MKHESAAKRKSRIGTRRESGSVDENSVQSNRTNYVLETRDAPIHYRGFSVPSSLEALWPETGEDAVVELTEALRRDGAYRALRDYVDTISSGASVRKLRERLNLTQKEAGELLGGGANAFQKYETGEVAPSQAMVNVLRLLANDPARVEELRLTEENLPQPIPKKKKADNRTFSLWRRKGLADSDIVVIAAEGLRTRIMLVELKNRRKDRDWAVMTQRMGVKRKGRMLYRTGPLDKKPVEEIVSSALREHGLDPDEAGWKDILVAANA
jgi:HTH-type transcriptional regulator/antitoxin MqsA